MKKALIFICLLSINFSIYSQNISYGVVLGSDFYFSSNNNGTNYFVTKNDELIASANLGVYFEKKLNNKLRLKIEITSNEKKLVYKKSGLIIINEDVSLNYLDISPSLKYFFRKDNNKGLYLMIGTRVSILTKSSSENDILTSDFYEKTNFGMQLGLGKKIFNFLDLQGKLDYGISPFFEIETDKKSTFANAYLSLFIDLEKILKKA